MQWCWHAVASTPVDQTSYIVIVDVLTYRRDSFQVPRLCTIRRYPAQVSTQEQRSLFRCVSELLQSHPVLSTTNNIMCGHWAVWKLASRPIPNLGATPSSAWAFPARCKRQSHLSLAYCLRHIIMQFVRAISIFRNILFSATRVVSFSWPPTGNISFNSYGSRLCGKCSPQGYKPFKGNVKL